MHPPCTAALAPHPPPAAVVSAGVPLTLALLQTLSDSEDAEAAAYALGVEQWVVVQLEDFRGVVWLQVGTRGEAARPCVVRMDKDGGHR